MPHPYYWTIPSTIEPPLYSGFLYLVQFFQRSDILIHLIQILALFGSAYLLYRLLKDVVRKELAIIISCLFLLIPNNLIMVSAVMAEPIALFFMAFYIYLVYEIVEKKKWHLWKYLIVFSAIIILQRFNFIVLYGFALFFVVLNHVMPNLFQHPKGIPQQVRNDSKQILLGIKLFNLEGGIALHLDLVALIVSFVIIFSWIFVNHRLNGAWGFSNSEGKHLYDRIVGGDGLLPSENNPQLKQLKAWVGEGFDVRKPWWDIEYVILPKFGMDETKQNHFLGQIALAALKEHPADYTINTVRNFFLIHQNGIIFPRDLYTYGWMGSLCRTIGTVSFCSPIIKKEIAKTIWNSMVKLSEYYYNNIPFYVNLILLFPALIYTLLQKKVFWRLCALIYIASVFVAVMVEVPVYRYLYPLYPLKLLLMVYFGVFLIKFRKKNIFASIW